MPNTAHKEITPLRLCPWALYELHCTLLQHLYQIFHTTNTFAVAMALGKNDQVGRGSSQCPAAKEGVLLETTRLEQKWLRIYVYIYKPPLKE